MSIVRNIDAVFVGCYDGNSICYKSQQDITDVVIEFIERSDYKDIGYKPKVIIIETNPNNSWDRCHHIKVKNRVPYFIEISAFNPKSWYITLYSKKPVKENGYSHNYLSDVFGELKDYIIANKIRPQFSDDVETYPGEIQQLHVILVCFIWALIIVAFIY